ncbi:MAG TPA: hypothetical protein VMT18_16105 [Planctomycetota bacterium]|nr:hypothetical protein [Planctomycetota bacterium]
MDASFEEKSAWIQLSSLLLALLGYGFVAGRLMVLGVDALPAYAAVFGVAVVVIVAVNVVGHALAALTGRVDYGDERDSVISWRAESRSGWLLGLGVVASLVGLVAGVAPLWIAHALLLSLFASEILRLTLQLVDYRRGF